MKRLVCFASIAAFASVAVSQDSRPTSQPKESPKQALRARADEYARLRLADDWSTLYWMTEPEHRAKVGRERFMQFHGHGYLLTWEIEILDVGFDDALNNGATRFRVTVELQPDKLPIKPKVEMKPEDLRKATDYDLMWRRIDGTWYFAIVGHRDRSRPIRGMP